jgi:hypothetical protein
MTGGIEVSARDFARDLATRAPRRPPIGARAALQHGLALVTHNVADFDAIKIKLINPYPWPGLDRLGVLQALGGLVLGLIAVFSSYDHTPSPATPCNSSSNGASL